MIGPQMTTAEFDQTEAVVFDLGGVIMNLDYDRTVRAFWQLSPEVDRGLFYGNRTDAPFFTQYEIGAIDTDDFIDRFRAHFKLEISRERFIDCWNLMILEFPREHFDLLLRIRDTGKKIFLLSNINSLHETKVAAQFAKLGLEFPFESYFDEIYFSHHRGMRKPSRQIFDLIVDKHRLPRNRTLFIDDTAQHVEGAAQAGLRTIHHDPAVALTDYFITLK